MGDRINGGGIIRHVTTVRTSGAIVVVDGLIELATGSVQRVETCRQLCEHIAQPCGTKPTARAFLALMIGRDQSSLSPDRDTVCDILKTHLANCYQHGV